MSFEADYISILEHAKMKVRFFLLNIEPEDLLNDAYVNLHGKPYSKAAFLKEIANLSLIEKHNTPGSNLGKNPRFTGDNVCNICKQTKPVSEFYLTSGTCGKRFLMNTCKVCFNKTKYQSKINRAIKFGLVEKNKETNRLHVYTYLKKNKLKWKKYLKERYDSEKQNLTDRYIIKLLIHKYTKEHLISHPEIVNSHRQRLIKKIESTKSRSVA